MDALKRTLMTISCADCEGISKVAEAGRIIATESGAVQVMHNGLHVVAGGYHGDWMAHVIRALRGHHEPQEERVFHSLLRFCRHDSLIVELGAFWAYYSLWYLNEIPGSSALCVEPDPNNRALGETNAALNGLDGRMSFYSAWVGDREEETSLHVESLAAEVTLPCVNMDAVLRLAGTSDIEVLHMDVQGAELPFLRSIGAAASGRVRFLVVSTHHSSISGSKNTHSDCVNAIRKAGGNVLLEHDVQESFSGDGLIVASFFSQDAHIEFPTISRNSARNSLFPEL